MPTFDEQVQDHQSAWRKVNIASVKWGGHGKGSHPWILPSEYWEENLWPPIRRGSTNSLPKYLDRAGAHRHTGSNNLKSSWVLCANLYFPFGWSDEGKSLLAGFLKAHVDRRIESVDRLELEYAEEGALSPATLLGEAGGARGKGQTSPDVAYVVNGGRGLILTESKYAEHSFYPCSARIAKDEEKRPRNPSPERCDHALSVLDDPKGKCHQVTWGRKYWDQLAPVVDREVMSQLKWCPAANGGYQLFRQQALAEGIANSGKYQFVVSCVAMDARNELLAGSLEATGIGNLGDWAKLFRGRARFVPTTHQAWVRWVRDHDADQRWGEWLDYVERRYGFAP